ncbi:MAG: PorV/PorQ family protein [Bacteroidetes bacterium]|nr:PorV/PorQ family protein [Bacteroidota bacterium]MBU1718932.1 PorV/PorQ family protein [Bacteroidota bacterium]
MKRIQRLFILAILTLVLSYNPANAGNEDRVGEAGGTQLLINPWARSSGWGNAANATVRGLESMYLNVAGAAFTKQTELLFTHTTYLKGTGININAFGITQKVGETGVLGIAVMTMGFGDIMITTCDLPEGGIGTFSPSYMNFNISYSKAFSASIYGGLNLKILNEAIADIRGGGIALDAGIQYVTGELENIKFGISLKNVGPKMVYRGDGLSFRGTVPGAPNAMTVSHRSAEFELPSLLNIGAAYDFLLSDKHRVTPAFNFTSNTFTKDQYSLGVEYAFSDYFMFRCAYTYEKDVNDAELRTSLFTGPSAGFTLRVPFNKEKGSSFELDYSFRSTNPFDNTHSIGARINL